MKSSKSLKILLSPVLLWVLICQSVMAEGEVNQNISIDIRKIIKRGYLKVAMVKTDQVPFFFKKDGKTVGIDIDLAKGIAKSLGVKLIFNREAESFNDLIPLVSNGKADLVISKLSRTLTRSKNALFSQPYLTFYQALAVNRFELAKYASSDTQVTAFIKSLQGRIGVVKGSSYVTYAKLYFPQAEIVELADWESVIRAVLAGEVLAAYRDEFEIKKILRANPEISLLLKIISLKDLKDDIAIAMSWSSYNLKIFVDTYLDNRPIKIDTSTILDDYSSTFKKLNSLSLKVKK